MSARSGARLEAVISGHACVFDGLTWSSSDPLLAAQLNEALAQVPEPRLGFLEVAEEVLHRAGVNGSARIILCREA